MKRSFPFMIIAVLFFIFACSSPQNAVSSEQESSVSATATRTSVPLSPTAVPSTFTPSPTPTPAPLQGYLPEGALLNLGRGEIYDIAVSSDGRKIGLGSVGGVYILDGFDYHEIAFISTESPNYRVTGVDFSPDGSFIAILSTFKGYSNDYLSLYDSNTYQLIKQNPLYRNHDYGNSKLLFSPTEPYVAIMGESKNIYTWDYEKGQIQNIYRSTGDKNFIRDIAFSPNGELFLASAERVVSIDAGGGIINRYDRIFEERVYSVAVSPDGKMAAGRQDNMIVVWNLQTGEEIIRDSSEFLKQSQFSVSNIAFSKDNRFVYTGKEGGLAVWNIEGGIYETSLKADELSPEMHYVDVAILEKGHILGISSKEEFVVWNFLTEKPVYISSLFSAETMAGAFSHDGNYFALSISPEPGADEIRVFDLNTGALSKTIEQLGTVWGVSHSNLDLYLVSRYGGAAQIYDTDIYEVKCTVFESHPHILFSPDDKQYAYASEDGFTINTLPDCKTSYSFSSSSETSTFTISKDWKHVFEGTGEGDIKVYDAKTQELKYTLEGLPSTEKQIIISLDEKYLAYSAIKRSGNKTFIFDLETKEVLGTLNGAILASTFQSENKRFFLQGNLLKVSELETLQSFDTLRRSRNLSLMDGPVISPDGNLAALSGMDSKNKGISIYIIDIATDDVLYRYEGHSILFPNIQMVFSPDSQSLLSMARGDGSVLLWDTSH